MAGLAKGRQHPALRDLLAQGVLASWQGAQAWPSAAAKLAGAGRRGGCSLQHQSL